MLVDAARRPGGSHCVQASSSRAMRSSAAPAASFLRMRPPGTNQAPGPADCCAAPSGSALAVVQQQIDGHQRQHLPPARKSAGDSRPPAGSPAPEAAVPCTPDSPHAAAAPARKRHHQWRRPATQAHHHHQRRPPAQPPHATAATQSGCRGSGSPVRRHAKGSAQRFGGATRLVDIAARPSGDRRAGDDPQVHAEGQCWM